MVKGRSRRIGRAKGLRTLDRKLVRDLWAVRGQAAAIALVIAAGIALFVGLFSTFDSLDLSLRTYYDRYRFGDVFASLTRAPQALEREIEAIPGVAAVDTRVVMDVTLDVPGLTEPAVGRLISVPGDRRPTLDDVFLREGRYLEPGHADEVLVSEGFARAHRLSPGDGIGAVINGRRRELRIVGLALSPEYIYPIRPGELMPDEARFGVLWMERRALASAFDMDGAFNNVVVKLMHDASSPDVIGHLDQLLDASYGGVGAIPRALQTSNWFLANELAQLSAMGLVVPIVFLGVAAFLLNVVLSRIVSVQRMEIAAIKALGYSNGALAAHYLKWSLIVSVSGALVGVGAGAWLGWLYTRLYASFFHFPLLLYALNVRVAASAVLIGAGAAVVGALGAVRRVVNLPPAEAMRPEPPARFTVSFAERVGLRRFLSEPARIIVRTLQRHPARVGVSILGIALGASLLVVANFSLDAIDVMLDVQFNIAQRQDLTVTFAQPTSASALDEVRQMPGVVFAEPFRAIAVRLRSGPRSRNVAIVGVVSTARLNRVVDVSQHAISLPPDGLVLSTVLGDVLRVQAGDVVQLDVLEGSRETRDVPVVSVVDDLLGANAYMDLDALHRLMREDGTLSGAYLQVDRSGPEALYRRLKATPRVAGVLIRQAAIDNFQNTMKDMVAKVQWVYVVFAAVIAFGVVYNSARISLAERSRELATLRVIGFTRGEISYILLGEFALLTAAAVPIGLVLGYGFAWAVVVASNTEMFRIPLIVGFGTYTMAGVTIIIATALSALVVRRRLDRLNLVEVLKTRE